MRLEALPTGSQIAVFTHGQFIQAIRLLVHFPALGDSAMKDRFQALDHEHPIENGGRIEGVIQNGRLRLRERLSNRFFPRCCAAAVIVPVRYRAAHGGVRWRSLFRAPLLRTTAVRQRQFPALATGSL